MENNPCQQCLGREVNKPVQREFNTGSFREFRIFVSGFGKQHPVSYIDIIRQSHRFLSGPFFYVRNTIILHLLRRDHPPPSNFGVVSLSPENDIQTHVRYGHIVGYWGHIPFFCAGARCSGARSRLRWRTAVPRPAAPVLHWKVLPLCGA